MVGGGDEGFSVSFEDETPGFEGFCDVAAVLKRNEDVVGEVGRDEED